MGEGKEKNWMALTFLLEGLLLPTVAFFPEGLLLEGLPEVALEFYGPLSIAGGARLVREGVDNSTLFRFNQQEGLLYPPRQPDHR